MGLLDKDGRPYNPLDRAMDAMRLSLNRSLYGDGGPLIVPPGYKRLDYGGVQFAGLSEWLPDCVEDWKP